MIQNEKEDRIMLGVSAPAFGSAGDILRRRGACPDSYPDADPNPETIANGDSDPHADSDTKAIADAHSDANGNTIAEADYATRDNYGSGAGNHAPCRRVAHGLSDVSREWHGRHTPGPGGPCGARQRYLSALS